MHCVSMYMGIRLAKGAVSLRRSEAALFQWNKNTPKTPETVKESGVCSIM